MRTEKKWPLYIVLALVFLFCFTAASSAEDDPDTPLLMRWSMPREQAGIIEGLDLKTLELLTESGVVQYFQPRKEKDRWNVVAGVMINAPADVVWEVVSDHPGLCQVLSDTFDSCETISSEGNKTKMHYLLHTSVVKFSFKMDIIDEITESPPRSWHLDTIEGSMKGREIDLLLVPAGDDRTMAFMRYYGAMRSINSVIRMVLMLLPDFESPVYTSVATYHISSYKKEAEKRVGYTPPRTFKPIDYSALDPETLNRICNSYGGLVRETPEGKTINGMAFTSIDAPAQAVWEVMSDFEHYDSFFPDSTTIVEKRENNEVTIRQNSKTFNAYIFSFDFDTHAHYVLDEPRRMSYKSIDGLYRGSKGDFVLVPYDNGKKTFVFATTEIETEHDNSLTMRIVKSGSFPFESGLNMFFSRRVLNRFKTEVERRRNDTKH